MPSILIAAAYRFVELDDAASLRETLFQRALQAGLKGTVLIAPEGINLSLAGADAALRGWLAALRADLRFDGLELKLHTAQALPFKRLRVKLKNEIVRMNESGVRPQAGRAPAVD